LLKLSYAEHKSNEETIKTTGRNTRKAVYETGKYTGTEPG